MSKSKILSFMTAATMAVPLFVVPLAQADDDGPNPGDDNPGSTTIEVPFYFVGYEEGSGSCFRSADWCAAAFADVFVGVNVNKKGNATVSAQAAALAELACAASARASSEVGLFFEGGGLLSLTRHGNHGAMHHIEFSAGLSTGAVSYVTSAVAASAWAHTDALVIANAESLSDVCSTFVWDGDPIFEICSWAEASGVANASAHAYAAAYGSGSGGAGSGSSGGVGMWTGVWGANIEEFHAVVEGGASSFANSEASSYAQVLAEAYVSAFASVFTEACASIDVFVNDIGYAELCADGFAAAAAQAQAYATAWTEAYASSMAEVSVSALMPATYINENGIYDTISFGPGTSVSTSSSLEVSCQVPEPPDGA
jgi:hypothetical protein